MKKKNILKLINLSLISLCLASCQDSNLAALKKGYTAKIVYNLGEGTYLNGVNEYKELTLYYLPDSYVSSLGEDTDYYGKYTYEGYHFVGWYLDENLTNAVDFKTYKAIGNTTTNFYAKWEKVIDSYYIIHYVDDEGNKICDDKNVTYSLDKNYKYSSSTMSPDSTKEYTLIGSYSDASMTVEIDSSYKLTKGQETREIYSKWVEGNYSVVNSSKDLVSALNSGKNIYINSDIDMINTTLGRVNLDGIVIKGNSHKISNLTMKVTEPSKTTQALEIGGIFNSIENSTISNLEFTNLSLPIELNMAPGLRLGTLAYSIKNSTLTNVVISGTYSYVGKTIERMSIKEGQSEPEIKEDDIRINKNSTYMFSYAEENVNITNCSCNITKED